MAIKLKVTQVKSGVGRSDTHGSNSAGLNNCILRGGTSK